MNFSLNVNMNVNFGYSSTVYESFFGPNVCISGIFYSVCFLP